MIVCVELLAALMAVFTNVATGVLPSSWQPYLWLAWPGLGVLIAVSVVLIMALHRASSGPNSLIGTERAAFSRRAMLRTARIMWVDGVLAHSLHRRILVELGLESRPDLLCNPWDLLIEEPEQRPAAIAPGTPVDKLLQQHGSLLIVGAAGGGKTTLLLGLLGRLVAAAERDEVVPIPVVFQLATWRSEEQTLDDWLADELSGPLYSVPRDVATHWIAEERVLPLLDGLDEVALDRRIRCARAIEMFRREHGLLPLVVTSRIAEYDTLGLRFALGAALLVQPLTEQQLNEYLARLGEPLNGLRSALRNDEILREMLLTPFVLSVAMHAYANTPAAEVSTDGSPDERRRRLFATFVERALAHRQGRRAFDEQDAMRWLGYIARSLGRRLATVFHVEQIDITWLPWRQNIAVAFQANLPSGVFIGVSYGLMLYLASGPLLGAIAGTFAAACYAGWLALNDMTSQSHVGVGPRTKQMTVRLVMWLLYGVVLVPVAAVIGGVVGLVGWAVRAEATDSLAAATFTGALAGGLFALPAPFLLLRFPNLPGDDRPVGRVVRDTVRAAAALVAVVGGLAATILAMVYGPLGALTGVLVGVTGGYIYGGRPLVEHHLTRRSLARIGLAPRKPQSFLDFAAARMLMHRVGGGYMFAHRLLLEYFARLESAGLPRSDERLATVDLTPEELFKRARSADTSNQETLSTLFFMREIMPVSAWAPEAMAVAERMRERLPQPLPRGTPVPTGRLPRSASSTFRQRFWDIDRIVQVLRLIETANHPDLSPAATLAIGEVLSDHLHGSGTRRPDMRRDAIAALRSAAATNHPILSARASTLLSEVSALPEHDEFYGAI